MNARNLAKKLVVGITLVCFFTGYVQADKLELQAKLGKQIKIELRDVTIVEALEKISKKAGVKIVLSDEAVWRLPQGEATRLSVMMEGPPADSMTEMLNAFFMRYAVSDEEITIYPRPELDHIMGRPTTKQLQLLKAIYTNSTEQYVESLQNTIKEAIGEPVAVVPLDACGYLDRALHELSYQDFIDDSRPEGYKFKLPGPMTVANMLQHSGVTRPREEAGQRKMWMEKGRWYLSDAQFPHSVAEIRLLNEPDFCEAKLDQVVDISFKDQSAELIIQRLAKWTGMELRVEKGDPSWLSEKISVNMQNVTLRQALRNVVSSVDGESHMDVEDCQIEIDGPLHEEEPTPSETTEAEPGDYVGKISIPMEGGAYYIEFMLRESDLTDELKKLRQEKIKKVLGESPKLK
ncbi:MAG: hypothetical protein ACYS4W_02280 [Planctomycetota bacterium]|jgi:hypothetical protein